MKRILKLALLITILSTVIKSQMVAHGQHAWTDVILHNFMEEMPALKS
jgi:hypothetical protein